MKKKDISNFVLLDLVIIWIIILSTHFLYNSMPVGNVVSDVSSAQATVSFNVVIGKDTTPPTIISTIINPYSPIAGENVFLDLLAIDDRAIDTTYIRIVSQNRTITLPPSVNYTAEINGMHHVISFANDTSGNSRTEGDYFFVGTRRKNVTFNFADFVSNSVPVSLNIYLTGKNKKINAHNSTKTSAAYVDTFYDLEYLIYDEDFKLKLKEVNLLLDDNKTLWVDQVNNLTDDRDLVIYAVQNTYNFTEATITINYADLNYADQDYLIVYKCEDWDFINNTCFSEWEAYPSIIDKTTNTLNFTITSFSAFLIRQESMPAQQPSFGGGDAMVPPIKEVPNATKELPKDEEKVNVSEKKPIEKKEEKTKDALIEMPSPEIIIEYNLLAVLFLFLIFVLIIYFICKQIKPILKKKQHSFKKNK